VRRLALTLVLAALAAALAPTVQAATAPCRAPVDLGVLPVWARAGFTDPKPQMPHVLGANRRIVAILFGYPLAAPPAKRRNNKILWVARRPQQAPSDLRISARRWDGTRPVGRPVARRVAGGPGPSIVDLPAAGCWRLTLRWGSRVDTLELRYSPEG
jgi:hypothetical protein